MPQSFEVNLESVYISLNGNDASAYAEHEMVDPQLFVDRNADGQVIGLEVFGPMRLTTENNPMRVQHRMELMHAEAEELGQEDVDESVLAERAHVRASAGGTYVSNYRRAPRGATAAAPEEERRTGTVVNPLATPDTVRDMEDANLRDSAMGTSGRRGVGANAPMTESGASLEERNAREETMAREEGNNDEMGAANERARAADEEAAATTVPGETKVEETEKPKSTTRSRKNSEEKAKEE